MRYGKSYGQWSKEVEWYIRKLGLSEQYANAQAICVRSLYGDKYHFADTGYAAKYALRNVIAFRNTNTTATKSKTIRSECRKINKSRGVQMKRIAIIESEYVRDTQVFTADPSIVEADLTKEDNYVDVKYPCQYIGVFEGVDENGIKQKAADSMGVHPDIISLVEFT